MIKDKILILSEDQSVISPLKEAYDINTAVNEEDLKKKLEESPGAFVMVDADKGGIDGLALYKDIKKQFPGTTVIMLSTGVTIPQAVEAAKLGVSDFIKKPVTADKLLLSVKSNFLPEGAIFIEADPETNGQWLAGSGSRIRSLLRSMEQAIKDRKNVIFIAEAGIDVGGLVNLFHSYSGKDLKMKKINMLAFQKENLETIFWTMLQDSLAEADIIYLSDLNVVSQEQRLSIIDYIRSRSSKGRVRVIVSLERRGEEPAFGDWEIINVPSLIERKEDLPEMIDAYLAKYTRKYGKHINSISLDVLNFLTRYSWPGNYREFEAVMENAVLLSKDDVLTIEDVQVSGKMLFDDLMTGQPDNLLEFKKRSEKTLIGMFVKKSGSKERAADLLDVPISRIKV